MATTRTPSLTLLLKAGLIFSVILPYTKGLPQLSDVLFPDFSRDPDTIRICQQQGGRNCPGVGNSQVLQPSLIGQACRGGGSTIQMRLLRGSFAPEGCDLMQGNVAWPGDTSKCAKVLSEGPCGQGHWVILSNDIAEGSICAPRPCGSKDSQGSKDIVLMNGQCYHVSDNSMCPPTMTIQTDEFGNGDCECPLGTIYHQQTNRCYTPYSQGPCQQGFIIKAMDFSDHGTSQCVRNSCPDQNMAPLDQQCLVAGGTSTPSQCHIINTKGPCSNSILSIDGTSAEPGCSDRSILADFGPCRRGSRRDRQRRCRRIFNGGKKLRRPQNPRQLQNQRPRCNKNQLLLGGICITKG